MKGLFQNLVGRQSKSFELSEFVFDTDYQRLQLPSPGDRKASSLDPFEQIGKKASLVRLDEEYVHQFKGFEKLCRENFLELLRKIKFQKRPNVRAKLVFLDPETAVLFRRLVTWLEIKNADIACLFVLDEDRVSNHLTQNGSLFYLISIGYLKKHEKEFLDELKKRRCIQSSVHIREQRNRSNEKQNKLVDQLARLTKNEVNYLNIFVPVNESVILLDNTVSSLRYLVNLLRSTRPFHETNLFSANKNAKYSSHLAYLLFKSNLRPSIRYLSNFNEGNRRLAESTLGILQKSYEENSSSIDAPDSNCLLLIIDRTLDFFTPLLHSKTYYQFVNQELELVLGTEFGTLDEQLEESSLAEIPEKLIAISKRLHAEHAKVEENHRTLSELALFDRKASLLGKHIVYVNRLRDKLQSGYQHLVNAEGQLLNDDKDALQASREEPSKKAPSKETPGKGKSETKRGDPEQKSLKSPSKEGASKKEPSKGKASKSKSETKGDLKRKRSSSQDEPKKQSQLLSNLVDLEQKEFVVYLKKILGADISVLDWKRILCLYSAVKEPLKKESIKIVKDILTKTTKQELDAFVALIRQIELRNGSRFVSLKSLLSKIQANELDESRYPTVNALTSSPVKLLIFVCGGISFNELSLVKTNPNTTLISDCILYPKNFFLDGLLV